jgi:signal transduction histidine kinase
VYAYRVSQIRKTEKLRLQIAGDLHDEIGGNLGSITLRAQLLGRRETLSEKADEDLRTITKISNETAQAMRDIVWLINPENDNLDSMVLKLRNTAKNLLEGVHFEFETDDMVRTLSLKPDKRKQLFLIYKEALNNIRKHAKATTVRIILKMEGGKLSLTIEDNGKGFDITGDAGEGMGLSSIKRRATDIDADLHLSSSPGEGTSLMLKL